MTTFDALDFDGWLAVSGDPKFARLHFLGPNQPRITFYSQQVRALRLVHALSASDQLKLGERTAVVGAGAAGVTAALAFALAGAEVCLYDPAAAILQLQSASPRLLHPHIYEWPSLGSLDDRAALPLLDWTAASGGEVCAALSKAFDSAAGRLNPRLIFHKGHTLQAVSRIGDDWSLIFAGGDGAPKRFARVVVATGFGEEAPCEGGEVLGYWKSGAVDAAAAEPVAGARYLVSGKGDGGLSDLMTRLEMELAELNVRRRESTQRISGLDVELAALNEEWSGLGVTGFLADANPETLAVDEAALIADQGRLGDASIRLFGVSRSKTTRPSSTPGSGS